MGQETAYVSHTCEQDLHACEVPLTSRTPSQRGEGASATASVPNSQQNSEAASHVPLFRHEPVESSQPSICFANGKVREVAAQHWNVLRSCAFLRRAASSKGNKHEKEIDLPMCGVECRIQLAVFRCACELVESPRIYICFANENARQVVCAAPERYTFLMPS